MTTPREIVRVALVAAEAGARFQRDGVGEIDAMTWMLEPNRRFGGSAPIDAVRSRDGCLTALLVHGLGGAL